MLDREALTRYPRPQWQTIHVPQALQRDRASYKTRQTQAVEISIPYFVGLAIVYGTVTSVALAGGFHLCGYRRTTRLLPLLGTTFTFIFLTQHPFPVPGSLICPVATAQPQLIPFMFLDGFTQLYAWEAPLGTYFTNTGTAATMMNFGLCLVIGLALGRHTTRMRVAMLYGIALTLGVELTQLTGTWGIYPCAYRQFDVDDLILNASGVIAGVVLMSRTLSRRRSGSPC